MSEQEIGKGQMRVMRILWDRGTATAQEILDIMNLTEQARPTTVWTFLRILVNKGLVGYTVEGRTFVYHPLVEESSVANHAVRDLIDHMFSGSREAFASFIVSNRYIEADEIDNLRRHIMKDRDKK